MLTAVTAAIEYRKVRRGYGRRAWPPCVTAGCSRRVTARVRPPCDRQERRAKLAEREGGEEEGEEDKDAAILERLRTMGPCPQGFSWFRQGNGWRCCGGSHFVYDDDPLLNDL